MQAYKYTSVHVNVCVFDKTVIGIYGTCTGTHFIHNLFYTHAPPCQSITQAHTNDEHAEGQKL